MVRLERHALLLKWHHFIGPFLIGLCISLLVSLYTVVWAAMSLLCINMETYDFTSTSYRCREWSLRFKTVMVDMAASLSGRECDTSMHVPSIRCHVYILCV